MDLNTKAAFRVVVSTVRRLQTGGRCGGLADLEDGGLGFDRGCSTERTQEQSNHNQNCGASQSGRLQSYVVATDHSGTREVTFNEPIASAKTDAGSLKIDPLGRSA